MDRSKKILLIWGIASIFCIVSMFFFDFNTEPQLATVILIAMLMGSTSIFLITLFFRYPFLFVWIFRQIYTNRLKNLNSIINSEGSHKKDLSRFLPFCVIIITLTMYLFTQASFKIFLLLVPDSNFLQETSITCKNAAATLFKTNAIAIVALTLSGPVWIFLLRQIRKLKNPITSKIRGSQSLLFYCYFILALFIASYFVYIGCPRAPGIYMYISPDTFLSQYFTDALIIGIPVSLMIFILDRFVIRSIKT